MYEMKEKAFVSPSMSEILGAKAQLKPMDMVDDNLFHD